MPEERFTFTDNKLITPLETNYNDNTCPYLWDDNRRVSNLYAIGQDNEDGNCLYRGLVYSHWKNLRPRTLVHFLVEKEEIYTKELNIKFMKEIADSADNKVLAFFNNEEHFKKSMMAYTGDNSFRTVDEVIFLLGEGEQYFNSNMKEDNSFRTVDEILLLLRKGYKLTKKYSKDFFLVELTINK